MNGPTQAGRPFNGNEPDPSARRGSSNSSDAGIPDLQSPPLGLFASVEDVQEYQIIRDRKLERLNGIFYPLVFIITLSWVFGTVGASWAWMIFLIGGTWIFVKDILDKIVEDFVRLEAYRVHRKRALQCDETCEWLNLILNRWWLFSSASIFSHLKALLDPRLHDAKPAFLESINLKHLDLGNDTPCIKSVRSWDIQGNPSHRPPCSLHPPEGLALAPSHSLAILCDLLLDSDAFSAILEARIGHKGMGVDLDVGIEHLSVEGQVLVTVFLDSEVAFPHITRLSFSFTERPKVDFKVKILKSVQMMEVPVLKTWIHNLVSDALATAWVDPGQLEVNIHANEAFVPPEQRLGDLFAVGVLTVMIRIHKSSSGTGLNLEDDKWVVLGLGGKTHVSTPMTSPLWQFSCSFLLTNPVASSNLFLKVKTKRLITSTIAQYELPLNQYGFDQSKVAEIVLHKKVTKVMGGTVPPFHLRMEFTPLDKINLDNHIAHSIEEIGNGAGVLYINVHGADNLVTASGYSPSPYCLVFNSRKKVKTTHYISACSNPRWDCGVELLVWDVTSACITFVVCSLPTNAKMLDGDLLGIHTLNLSTVTLPLIRKQIPLNRNLSTSSSDAQNHPLKSSLMVSVVFRSVPSISVSNAPVMSEYSHRGMPLPIPLGSPSGNSGIIPTNYPSTANSSANHSPTSSWRGSSGCLDDEDHKKKHWLYQAKNLLSSNNESDVANIQDLGDILASGLGLIELTIIRARELVARDLNGFSDPYCVVKVNGEMKYRTKVRKKTLDPKWNESIMTHLPKKDQSLVITLWDHDAFGKDFLGSISLEEDQIRTISMSDNYVWRELDGVKSGSLQLKIKLISEDSQFDSRRTNVKCLSDGNSSSTMSSIESETGHDGSKVFDEVSSVLLPQNEGFKLSLPNRTNISHQKGFINGLSSNSLFRATSNPSLSPIRSKDSLNASEQTCNPLCTPARNRKSGAEILASALAQAKAESMESLNETLKPEIPMSTSRRKSSVPPSPLCKDYNTKRKSSLSCEPTFLTSSSVKLNEEIKEQMQSPDSTTITTNPIKEISVVKSCSNYEIESIHSLSSIGGSMRDYYSVPGKLSDSQELVCVPKISLNDQSEDDFGLSDDSSINEEPKRVPLKNDRKKKKKSDIRGLKAVREKVCRSLAHPLRRFRSEANVHRDISGHDDPLSTSLHAMSMDHSPSTLGFGGGEGDASELLHGSPVKKKKEKMSHAWSQPNLTGPALRNGRSWIPIASPLSTQVSSSSSYIQSQSLHQSYSSNVPFDLDNNKQDSQLRELQSSGTKFTNVRGVLKRVEGLHVPKTGLQLFARIRVSDARSGGRTSTKTVGRSRLVPASQCPIFECDWGPEGDLSDKSQVIIEIRTSSRDLVCSVCVPLVDLFKGTDVSSSPVVEKWVKVEGGIAILLKIQCGGQFGTTTTGGCKRKSLFRSWSMQKMSK